MSKKGNKNAQVVLTGTDEDNALVAADDTTKINGGDGNDVIVGGSQVDTINAGDGDDIITGGAGDDTIFGNDGHDKAVFSGSVLSYTWTPGKGNSWIVDGADGTDTLKHIEVLSFDDFDLNIDGTNNIVYSQADTGTTDEDNSTSIDVLANDIDFDGDTLSVTAASSAVPGVTVTVNPDNTVFYDPGEVFQYLAVGEEATDVVSYTVDDGNGGAVTETLTMTITGTNDGPSVAAEIVAGSTEDDAVFSVDLLDGASDVDDSDILTVSNLALSSGNAAGVTISGNILTVDPSAYSSLAVDESEVITYTYDVTDGNGGSVAQTATLTITGANDGPTVAAAIVAGSTEDDAVFSVDLLDGASDVDTSDILSVSNLALSGGNASGVTVAGNSLTVDPSAYNSLAVDESEVITYTYDVTDGNGGSVAQTAEVTINGVNDAPVISGGSVAGSVSEDNVLVATGSLVASDVDSSDLLSFSVGGSGTYGSLTIDSNGNWEYVLNNSSELVQGLTAADTVNDVFTVQVSDGNGGFASTDITLTVNGADDNIPVDIDDVSTDFENGFAGWETIGSTSIVGSTNNSGNMAQMNGTGASEAQIEAFFGAEIPDSYLGTFGSAIKTTLSLQAGDKVSFDYYFNTTDYLPYNDFAVFMGIDGNMELLSNVAIVGNYGESEWATVELTIVTTGVYDIGFASINAIDSVLHSQLWIDNLQIG